MTYPLTEPRLGYATFLAASAFALCFLYLFGIQGLMKSAPYGDDFHVFYQAGAYFLNGEDPWMGLRDSGTPFSYPPHTLAVVGFYNLFPFNIALALHTALNFMSILVLAVLANRWFLKIESLNRISVAQLAPLFLLVANPYMATSIHQGQLALPAAAAVFLSWENVRNKRWLLGGLFLGLATIKPQLSALYVIWLLLSLNLKPLVVGASLALLMMAPGLVVLGPIEVFESWFSSMAHYTTVAINAPGSPYVVGVESFLVAYGIEGSGIFVRLIALVALLLLYFKRALFDHIQIVHLFFVIAFTFFYGHDYDYAAVIGIFSYCLFLCLSQPTLRRLVSTAVLMFLFFVPQRIFRDIDLLFLQHMRTFLLPLCCFFVFVWSPTKRKFL